MAKPKRTNTTTPKKVSRSSAGLRDAIFDEIDAIRNGNSNPTRANAVAKLASGIVETVRMEIDVQKHLQREDHSKTMAAAENGGLLGAPLELGDAA